jgi:hypothetical protein
MGFRPGCRDVGIGPTHAARVGYDRFGWLAACSHARSTPEHEAPISAQNVCETLRDKSSCRVRFRGHFQLLDVVRFFAQRKRPIHFRKFPISTALPRQFCKNGQTSVLSRLAPINFHLRLHGSSPRTEVNVPPHPLFRSSRAYFKPRLGNRSKRSGRSGRTLSKVDLARQIAAWREDRLDLWCELPSM